MKLMGYTRMAFENVRRAKARSALAMVGVSVGVMAVVLLVAVGDAARTFVLTQFAGIGVSLIRITPGRTETRGLPLVGGAASRPITLDDVRYVRRRTRNGSLVSGMIIGTGTLKSGSRSRSLTVLGVDDPFPESLGMEVQSGHFFSEEDVLSNRRVCVLGHKAAEELFGQENPVGQYVDLLSSRFQIVGKLAPKGYTLGFDLDDLVTIPSSVAGDLLHARGVQRMLVKAPSRAAVPQAIGDATSLLAARHRGTDFTVINPDDLLNTVDQVMLGLTLVVIAIGSISLLVGGIGIANIMLLSVQERVKEIGVRRAIGARRRDIIEQFLCEAAIISGLGGALGAAVGVIVPLIARFAFNLPFGVNPLFVLFVIAFSAFTGVVAGLIPARNASAVSPLEAMRD